MPGPIFDFGPYRFDVAKRLLLRGGEPVPLTPKAFDVLLTLIERRDRVVDKGELMKLVWPDSFVEEANLSQTIFVLRKTLGDDENGRPFIDTAPRRGYRFAAAVRTVAEPEASPSVGRRWSGAFAAIALLVIAIVGIGAWTLLRAHRAPSGALAGKKRIVVLPFENLTHDRNDDWLAGAFSDSLTIGLQDLDDVICISRDRIVELYKQQAISESAALDGPALTRLSQTFGVAYYVHGTYQRLGDRIRVIARLVDTASGEVRTQETATDELSNLLKLEDDLAGRFASKLEAGERAAVSQPATSSLEAYRATVEGRSEYAAANPEHAVRYLRRAVELDPHYAEAWALLSETSSRLIAPATSHGGTADNLREAALTSALRAVELAPASYDTHMALALAYRTTPRDSDLWRAESEKAISLNPRRAEAYELLADWYFAAPGPTCARTLNPELAEKYFRTAVAIDSRFGAAWANLVYHLHFSGRLDDAIRTANDGVRQLPGSSGVIRARSTAFLYAGRLDDAERDVRGIAPEQQSTQDRVVLASVALMRGDAAHASAEFADVGRATPEPALELMIARSYFITGRLDEAMKHVDTAVALDSSCARFAATTPAFARYRDAAPFRERLARWQSTQ